MGVENSILYAIFAKRKKICLYTMHVNGAIGIIAFVICVVSWTLIPKWRTLKNLIFLNVTLLFVCRYTLTCVTLYLLNHSPEIVYKNIPRFFDAATFLNLALACWLLVMSVIVYSDLVIVFTREIERKFLKSCMFAWGLPTVYIVTVASIRFGAYRLFRDHDIQAVIEDIIRDMLFITLLVTNFVMFVKVVYSLLRKPEDRQTSWSVSVSVQIAALMFVLSGVGILPPALTCLILRIRAVHHYLHDQFDVGELENSVFAVINEYSTVVISPLQFLLLNVSIFALKTNRNLWVKSYRRIRYGAGAAIQQSSVQV